MLIKSNYWINALLIVKKANWLILNVSFCLFDFVPFHTRKGFTLYNLNGDALNTLNEWINETRFVVCIVITLTMNGIIFYRLSYLLALSLQEQEQANVDSNLKLEF